MTRIFSGYSKFLSRENKDINGVSPSFAEEYPNYEEDNENNKGCWNCVDCSGCFDCLCCSRCSECSNCCNCYGCSFLENKSDLKEINEQSEQAAQLMGNYPRIENIHQKVYEAASSKPEALNMSDRHTCHTTHCRAGWVVFLAGNAGKKLELHTSTLFSALQIYNASSSIEVSPVRFYEDSVTVLEDMKRCAELEALAAR